MLCGATASRLSWWWGPTATVLLLFSDYERATAAIAIALFVWCGNLSAVMLVAVPLSLWRCSELAVAVLCAALADLVLAPVYCRAVFSAALFSADAAAALSNNVSLRDLTHRIVYM